MAKKKASPANSDNPAVAAPARARRAPRRKTSTDDAAPASTTTDEAVETAADRTPQHSEPPATHTPSYEEIAEAAYLRFLQRGGTDGFDFDDWIEAEQQLRRSPHGASR